jgi:phage terminase small subunit
VLRNARHEKFALALAHGAAAPEAYERAGYAPGPRAGAGATRLSAKAELKARVAEIKARSADPTEASVGKLLGELEEARRLAIEIKQPAAAISATIGKARISGLIGEKDEGKPGAGASSELSNTEAARRIAFILRLALRAGRKEPRIARPAR